MKTFVIKNFIMKTFAISLLILSGSTLTSANLLCQEEDQLLFESEGTDFWFTFMPNYHSNSSYNGDSLHIFITSKTPTKGTIYYNLHRNNVTSYEHKFEITQPNQIYKFSIHPTYAALRGFNTLTTINKNVNDCEVPIKKAFRIVTEEKSSVYALDYANTTAEAFIVLPNTAIGKEYYVLAYNSDGSRGIGNTILSSSTPSQFAIVAVHNATKIKINPSAKTLKNGFDEQNIVLNQGDVYLVQADITSDNLHSDLSGTKITADKEIAVFAGHQRATMPLDNNAANPSRDCLIEQLISIHSWGRNAIITPFAKPTIGSMSNQNSDIFRVMAARNGTTIWVNDNEVAILNQGEFYEGNLIAALVRADKPIMVAQYKRTETLNSTGISALWGDPLMLIVPPVEQYKTDYNVINPQITTGRYSEKMFLDQFLTIITPDSTAGKVLLDGNFIPASQFISIHNSGFSYATVATTDGGHSITSTSPISVQIYGYGNAVSYGYLGGMSFKDLEGEKLSMMIDTCYSTATFTYNETFSSGIKSYQIIENINCEFEEEVNTKWQLKLSVRKNDMSRNAIFSIKVVDIYDFETIFTDTMRTSSFILKDLPQSQTLNFGDNKISSISSTGFYIVNTGEDAITFDRENFLMYNNIYFTFGKSDLPITLLSGDSAFIKVYYSPSSTSKKVSGKDFDTLLLSSKCNYYMIFLEGEPIADTFNLSSRCEVPIRVVADSILRGYVVPQVLPNPAVNVFKYCFSVSIASDVQINLYNSLGNLVEVIFSNFLDAGHYEVEISTRDLPQGSYFIKLSTLTEHHLNQLLLTR